MLSPNMFQNMGWDGPGGISEMTDNHAIPPTLCPSRPRDEAQDQAMNLPIVGFDWQMGLLPQLIEPNAVATTLPTPVFTVADRYG